jgi:flagellar protein FliS
MAIADPYLETRVLTASPQQLHLIVLDGALRYARVAHEALGRGDLEASHFAICRSGDFVSELIVGLRPGDEPELTERLKQLFLFVRRSLTQADVTHETEPLRDAIKILEMHRETWLEVMELLPKEAPRPRAAADTCWTT